MIIGKAITAGGSGGIKCKLNITTSPGAVVTATLGEKVVEAVADENGIAILILNKKGIWTVTATLDGMTITKEIDTSFSIEKNLSFFPAEPSSYEYMALITSSQTWTAPEDGYFQIEVFGASGSGGSTEGRKNTYGGTVYYGAGGGGGGGGGYSCSRVKMNKGDTIALAVGSVGANTSVQINSSLETYFSIQITSGKNGTNGEMDSWDEIGGAGGAGGVASGGNVANNNGAYGGSGSGYQGTDKPSVHGSGGAPGYTEGNTGGAGGVADYSSTSRRTTSGSSGSAGFIKIYRGNTNVVA